MRYTILNFITINRTWVKIGVIGLLFAILIYGYTDLTLSNELLIL